MPVVGHAALRIQILTGKTQTQTTETQTTETAVVHRLLAMVSQIPRTPDHRPARIRHHLRPAQVIVTDGVHRYHASSQSALAKSGPFTGLRRAGMAPIRAADVGAGLRVVPWRAPKMSTVF